MSLLRPTAGTTVTLEISLVDDDGEPVAASIIAAARVTIKEDRDDTDDASAVTLEIGDGLTVSDGQILAKIPSASSELTPNSRYYWSLLIQLTNGDIYEPEGASGVLIFSKRITKSPI